MAFELTHVTKIDLSAIIANASASVKAVRKSEQAKAEAEFQKAIAEGTLSYESQIKFREEQIRKEKASGFADPDFITELETSVLGLKKMARFQKMRDKYSESVNKYVAGKGNINSVINILENALAGEEDPDIKKDIQSKLSSALTEKTTLEKTAINNRITIAEKDKSLDLINDSIKEVKQKKAEALLAKDPETASMWDATLSSLNATKSTIKIQSAVADINYRINKENLSSGQKLGLLNEQISGSDSDTPVVFDGVRYDSMKDFWNQKTSEYISTNYLNEVKAEIEAETNRIAQISPFGQVPVARIEAVSEFYKGLAKRPEFVPFATEIEQQRVDTISGLTSELQTALADEGQVRVARGEDEFKVESDINKTYQTLESRLGIKLSRPAAKDEPLLNKEVKAPGVTTDAGKLPTIPGKKTALELSDEEEIAAGHLFSVKDGRRLTPAAPAAPAAPAIPNTPAPAAPKAPAPAAPAPMIPGNPTAPAKYAGNSIRDFLVLKGQDGSFEARKKIAEAQGIKGYTGTADQNLLLLSKLNV